MAHALPARLPKLDVQNPIELLLGLFGGPCPWLILKKSRPLPLFCKWIANYQLAGCLDFGDTED